MTRKKVRSDPECKEEKFEVQLIQFTQIQLDTIYNKLIKVQSSMFKVQTKFKVQSSMFLQLRPGLSFLRPGL